MSGLYLSNRELLDLFFHLHLWFVKDADELAYAVLLEKQSYVADLLSAITILLLKQDCLAPVVNLRLSYDPRILLKELLHSR